MQKKVSFNYKGRRISLKAEECGNFRKIFGLMFRSKNTEALLFNFNRQIEMGIHSIFVFFPFIAVWLDDKNKVIDVRKVTPFTLAAHSKKPYKKLIEIPVNVKNSKIVKKLFSRR